jgi:hypothetical protein
MQEELIKIMNLAEHRFSVDESDRKEDFVVRSMLVIYPEMTVSEIKFSIGVLIKISKITTKILFNIGKNNKCCIIS